MKIAISGASYSGKTTLLEKIEKIQNVDVKIYHENIRTHEFFEKYKTIENIRKHPELYLNFEIDAIMTKIEYELQCDASKINIFDRSIYDSIYYYIFYTDKSNFSEENIIKYYSYLDKFIKYCKNKVYDKIILLYPIKLNETINDNFRIKHLNLLQYSEYEIILSLINNFADNKILYKFNSITEYDNILYTLGILNNEKK